MPELESARHVGMTDHVAVEEDVDGLDGNVISKVRRALGEVRFEGIAGNGRPPQELTGRRTECFKLFGQRGSDQLRQIGVPVADVGAHRALRG